MTPRRLWLAVRVAVLLGLIGWAATQRLAADQITPAADGAAPAEEAKLSERLDQVLANDDKILAQFDAILSDLQVVKTRAGQRPHEDNP